MALVTFSCVVDGFTLFATTVERCGQDTVNDLSAGFTQIIEQDPAIDSVNMRLFGRAARAFTRSFRAEREHADVQAAATFHNTHLEAIPATVATVTIVIGSSTATYKGGVSQASIVVEGNRTIANYTLTLVKASP